MKELRSVMRCRVRERGRCVDILEGAKSIAAFTVYI